MWLSIECLIKGGYALLWLIWAASWQNQQMASAPSEDSYQPGHLHSLIRIFGVHMKKAWFLSYPFTWRKLGSWATTHWAHSKDWSDWAYAQADLSLHWAHGHFVGIVVRRLIHGYQLFLDLERWNLIVLCWYTLQSLYNTTHYNMTWL